MMFIILNSRNNVGKVVGRVVGRKVTCEILGKVEMAMVSC